jgi:hypothetical protein
MDRIDFYLTRDRQCFIMLLWVQCKAMYSSYYYKNGGPDSVMVGKDKAMTEISNSNNDLTRHRPTGLTILALLFIIAGAFTLLAGITTLETALSQASGPILTDLEALFIPLGIEFLCIASFVVALGLFTVKSWWVWLVAIVLSTIGLVVNVISLVIPNMLTIAITGALVGIAINAIVLYYLSRKNVRQYFGKMATPRESASTTVGV